MQIDMTKKNIYSFASICLDVIIRQDIHICRDTAPHCFFCQKAFFVKKKKDTAPRCGGQSPGCADDIVKCLDKVPAEDFVPAEDIV
jgi:hypothetical protein